MKNKPIDRLMKTYGFTHMILLICGGGICISPLASALEKPAPPREQGGEHRPERPPELADKGKKRPRDAGRGKYREDGFKQLDLDGDGALSFEEFSKSKRLARLEAEKQRRLFDFLDRNKDGKLQGAELRPRDPHWMIDLRKNFKQLDTDQSESLDFEEFSKAKPIAKKKLIERERMFKRLDRNKDGTIQRAEIKGRPRHRPRPDIDFRKYDVNQSGGLDFQEYSKLPFVSRFPDERRKKHFERIDKDGSGEISRDEIRGAHKRRPRPRHEGPPRPKRGE